MEEERKAMEARIREEMEERKAMEARMKEEMEARKATEQRLEEATEQIMLAKGFLWVTADKLDLAARDLPSEEPQSVTSPLFVDGSNGDPGQTLHVATAPDCSQYPKHKLPKSGGRPTRTRCWFGVDIFTATLEAAAADSVLAHLIPHSEKCRQCWIILFERVWGLPPSVAEKVLFGFHLPGGALVHHSNITWMPWNFIKVAAQKELYDDDPRFGFFNDMSWIKQKLWELERYGTLVIARSSYDYVRINAIQAPGHCTVKAASIGVDRLREIFEWFAEALAELSVMVRHVPVPEDAESRKFIAGLRSKLCELTKVPVPTLLDSASDLRFLYIQFGDGKDCAIQESHRAPHPVLLTVRTVNFWYNYLFQDKPGMLDIDKSGRTLPSAAALMPSCRDVTDGVPDCSFCREALRRADPILYGDLESDDDDGNPMLDVETSRMDEGLDDDGESGGIETLDLDGDCESGSAEVETADHVSGEAPQAGSAPPLQQPDTENCKLPSPPKGAGQE
eukprot:CAMPEP_0202811742 /NCGR_PEP_ID=MMETSP1389-20130828/3514_1 /ASSEMBLY_ACC=CAM_ASM_000865 /TAXON_ID=302021 /ORGANISM="Rhodomonas sp., Strain CCMP768" /LENGTH=506 /DNA_ID=CAMNT_0049482939 /DNA_START=3 /DNA_END=1523 /DNA_ORIENTATION=-